MSQLDIAYTILCKLYEARFSTDGTANLFAVREEEGWDKAAFDKAEDRLTAEGLIQAWTMGGNYRITSEGVISAEEQGIAAEELVAMNRRVRTLALDALAKVHEEKGSLGSTSYEYLIGTIGVTQEVLLYNLQVLQDLDYVESPFYGHYKITYDGLDAVEEWRQRVELVEEFERISEMRPQPRGRGLQKLFARVVEQYGWSQEEGIRTSHEEIDVIVYREQEYYLIECKWEKDAIESGMIRELYGKLDNRAGVRGIAVSMSGFTKGAVEQVEDYKNKRVILLFGSEDVHSMIFERVSFNELLTEKFKALVTRGRVSFS